MSVSSIGNINYINQNQGVAIDNLSKYNAKLFADEQISLVTPEVKVIEESSESAKANTDLDEERSSQEQGKKEQKRAVFFGIEIENTEEEESQESSDKIFDKLV